MNALYKGFAPHDHRERKTLTTGAKDKILYLAMFRTQTYGHSVEYVCLMK